LNLEPCTLYLIPCTLYLEPWPQNLTLARHQFHLTIPSMKQRDAFLLPRKSDYFYPLK
jgi:hypothetical protein